VRERLQLSILEQDLRENSTLVAKFLQTFARQNLSSPHAVGGKAPYGACVYAIDSRFVDLINEIQQVGDARQPIAAGLRHIVAHQLTGSLTQTRPLPSNRTSRHGAHRQGLPHNWEQSHTVAGEVVDPIDVIDSLSISRSSSTREEADSRRQRSQHQTQGRELSGASLSHLVLDDFAAPECRAAIAAAVTSTGSPTLTDCLIAAHVAASIDHEVVLFIHDEVLNSDLWKVVADVFMLPSCRAIVFGSDTSLATFESKFGMPDPRYPARFADLIVAAERPGAAFQRSRDWAREPDDLVGRWLPRPEHPQTQRHDSLRTNSPSLSEAARSPRPETRTPERPQEVVSSKPVIAWGTGARRGWAYEINARRIADRTKWARHDILPGSDFTPQPPYDLKISFDLYRHSRPEWRAIDASAAIVRIGGPYPPKVLADRGIEHLIDAYIDVDAVIALNDELADHAARLHNNVVVIPNGLDLEQWNPDRMRRRRLVSRSRRFTVGLAAALDNFDLRMMKGYHLAKAACSIARVSLRTIGVGHGQVRNHDMVDDFYRHIDCLIHPASYGKEGSSNVIMEALALGIPVITTRFAGFHGERLVHGESAMISRLDADCLADAIKEVAHDNELRRSISTNARQFAATHHDLDTVAQRYSELMKSVLSAQSSTLCGIDTA